MLGAPMEKLGNPTKKFRFGVADKLGNKEDTKPPQPKPMGAPMTSPMNSPMGTSSGSIGTPPLIPQGGGVVGPKPGSQLGAPTEDQIKQMLMMIMSGAI